MERFKRIPSVAAFCMFMLVVGLVILQSGDAPAQPVPTMTPARPTATPRPVVARPVARVAPRPVARAAVRPAPRPVVRAVATPAPRPAVVPTMEVKPVVDPKPAPAPTVPAAMEAAPVPAMTAAPATDPVKDVPAVEEKKNTDSTWKVILGGILQVLLLFVGAIATACGPYLIRWLASLAKVKNQETILTMNNLYDQAITTGVHFATQQSNKLNNNPEAKANRIKWATDKAQSLMKEWNLPEKTAGWIEDAIEAKLGEKNGKKEVKEESEVEKKEEEEKKDE